MRVDQHAVLKTLHFSALVLATMPIPDPATLSQPLPAATFHHLQALLQQTAEELEALIFSNTTVFQDSPTLSRSDRFTLIVSTSFSALLLANSQPPHEAYQVELTFVPDAIAAFLTQIQDQDGDRTALRQAQSLLQPNDPQVQSAFTTKLLSVLATPSFAESALQTQDLLQQIEQERLLNQVTNQICQSLELPVILQTAVDQARQFLAADRLVIYRLDQPQLKTVAAAVSEEPQSQGGSVIYESIASAAVPSVLKFSEAHCFIQTLQQGIQPVLAIAVNDVETRYAKAPCLLSFLQQAQVRSKLVVPLIVGDRLWGLLIAHQCFEPRHWQDNEQRFLHQIAERLAIGISQAQLYAELQQQKQTLEQRVIERTQELRDTVLAAQAANRAKSEFLASVSHELRTPLTCIIGMSATLQRWSGNSLSDDRQQGFLQTIHSSGEQLLSMINNILDLSQAEASKVALNLQTFSLSRLARQTLKTFARQAALNQVELQLDVRVDPTRDRFIADPRRLRQILFNLINNAVKFTPAGGKVMLRVFVEESTAILQVKDTGIGISEPQLPQLFQNFCQLDAGYQRQYAGTGLGLALTKQLVDLHSGSIEVESIERLGSVFTVRIPMQQMSSSHKTAEGKPVKLSNALLSDRPRGRLVLVEPNEETANLICDVLTAAGYQLVWLLEGSSAINQIEALRPIAVIIDTQLPDLDGYSLIRRLRQNPITKRLKVIALSPSDRPTPSDSDLDSPTNLSIALLAGADESVTQPIRPDRLLQAVISLTIPDL